VPLTIDEAVARVRDALARLEETDTSRMGAGLLERLNERLKVYHAVVEAADTQDPRTTPTQQQAG
jgi:hypothetical protein